MTTFFLLQSGLQEACEVINNIQMQLGVNITVTDWMERTSQSLCFAMLQDVAAWSQSCT